MQQKRQRKEKAMISVKSRIDKKYNEAIFELFCKSTDTLPTSTGIDGIKILNGSHAKEIDTGKEYLYDEDGENWEEQP